MLWKTVERSRALVAVGEVHGLSPAADLFRVMRMGEKDSDFFF